MVAGSSNKILNTSTFPYKYIMVQYCCSAQFQS